MFGGGLKHAVNQVTTQKKQQWKSWFTKSFLQNKFAKEKNYGAHVPSSVVPQK